MGRGKPPWSTVKLRVSWGEMPPFGATLVMRSGRRYQVIGINGRGLRCLVLPPEAESSEPVLAWEWAPRKKRTRARAARA